MWSNPRYVEVWNFLLYINDNLPAQVIIWVKQNSARSPPPRVRVVKATAYHLKHSKSLVISPMWVQA